MLRTDNGTEYANREVRDFLSSKGIILETTAPYTLEQNGKSEKENRTIVESARTMIKAKQLPKNLWGEAVSTAVYVLNRTINKADSSKTPYERWSGKEPSLTHLRIFGSVAYEHVPKIFRKKWDSKAKKKILGYQSQSTNYCLYDPVTKSISVSRNVIFNEIKSVTGNAKPEDEDDEVTFPSKTVDLVDDESGEDDDEEVLRPAEEQLTEGQAEQERQSPPRVRQLRSRELIRQPPRYTGYELNVVEYSVPRNQGTKYSVRLRKRYRVPSQKSGSRQYRMSWSLMRKMALGR